MFWTIGPAVEAFSQISYQWQVAIWFFVLFLLNWGYFTLFEAFCNGRTPGKRVAKIRVIQRSGRPIGFFESLARNLVRYVDQIPFFYAVGVIVMFVTRQHQRLGDLAAGTLVVRDREPETTPWSDSPNRTFTAQIFSTPPPSPEPHTLVSLPAADVAKLSSADLEVLEGFLRAPPGYVAGHPADAGRAHCRRHPRQVRARNAAGSQYGNLSGGRRPPIARPGPVAIEENRFIRASRRCRGALGNHFVPGCATPGLALPGAGKTALIAN